MRFLKYIFGPWSGGTWDLKFCGCLDAVPDVDTYRESDFPASLFENSRKTRNFDDCEKAEARLLRKLSFMARDLI